MDKGGRALLKTANVGQDAGVVDANDKDAFMAAADTPMGPGKVRSNIAMTTGSVEFKRPKGLVVEP